MSLLAQNWWLIAMRGLGALLFGILAFAVPGPALVAVVFGFGIYTLVDGVLTIVSAVRGTGGERRWWAMLLEGLLDIVAGILTFVIPSISAELIVILIAVWAMTTGVAEIRTAVRMRHEINGEWLLGSAGVLSVLFGALLFLTGANSLAVILLIGTYAVIFGLILIGLGFRLRGSPPIGVRLPSATDGAGSMLPQPHSAQVANEQEVRDKAG